MLLQKRIKERLFPSQLSAYLAPTDVVFFSGNRGGGKTDCILYCFLKHIGQGHGKDYKGIIFRTEYKDLAEIKDRANDIFLDLLPNDAIFKKSDSVWEFTWGEKLYIHHAYKTTDYRKYHGHQLPFIGFDEMTMYPDLSFYDLIRTTNRSKFETTPKKIIIACNPYGPNHNRLKSRFIDKADYNEIYYEDKKSYVNIFSSFFENPYILKQEDYIQTLLSDKNTHRKRAWVAGDWNITSGGVIDDLWTRRFHTFDLYNDSLFVSHPDSIKYYCILDWGSARPFAVCFFALINDLVKLEDYSFNKGDILLLSEIYGTKGEGTNEGLNLSPEKVQERILKYIENRRYPFHTMKFIADSQIFQQHGIPSIASHMNKIPWESAVKGKDSRTHGLTLFRQYLAGSIPNKYGVREQPGFFVNKKCKHWINTVVKLPRDPNNPEDAMSENVEDHLYDCTRYLLQSDFKQIPLKMLNF